MGELEKQIREYIDFSKGKWNYYTKLWKFDRVPVTLSYDQYDLLSIRKHSILYNGLYSGTTPENSDYTNRNF